MDENDKNVLVTPTVQTEKANKETIRSLIKTLEDYCLSNSLPKPVFQTNCIKSKNHEVLAKVGTYEAKGSGKLSHAKRDAVNNLLSELKGLETKIQTEKLKKENIQIQANISTNNLNSSLMKDQNVLDTPNIKAKKSKEEIQQKILQMQQQMQEQNSTENLKKGLGFGSEACKEPNTQIPANKSTDNLNSSLMKQGSWIWIEGLQGAKDLNGKLGQIVKFNKDKQRYEVFIPDSNGFNSRDFLPAKSILDKIHTVSQIEFIHKIFRQEDESSLIGEKTFHISAYRIYLFISKSENNFILNFRYETYQT